MQWLEHLLFFVSRFTTFTFACIIIVHYHSVYAKFDDLWFGHLQLSYEQLVDYLVVNNGHLYEEPFYLVERCHLTNIVFQHSGIALIFLFDIKTRYGHICAINE